MDVSGPIPERHSEDGIDHPRKRPEQQPGQDETVGRTPGVSAHHRYDASYPGFPFWPTE